MSSLVSSRRPLEAPHERRVLLVALLHGERTSFPPPSEGTVTLGRGRANDIRLPHKSVSRRHAVLHCRAGELFIEDVGSRNGTRLFSANPAADGDAATQERSEDTHGSVAEWRIDPGQCHALRPGDVLRVGSVLIRVQAEPSPSGGAALEKPQPAVVQAQATRRVYELAGRVAASSISVLILGETGVGKDVLARAIHEGSPRAQGPFVRVHCAALAENLLESELFGHVRGAFTGAVANKQGLLESANGGTLFLDELGEMSLSTQVKLLNVLETGQVLRIGSTRPSAIDVRFIAATNRDLPVAVEQGAFRRDLYFRINGMTLRLPPLRERRGDIEPLARHFVELAAVRLSRPAPELSPEAMQRLLAWRWPGNVRELRNVIDRAVLLCTGSAISAEDVVLEEEASLVPLDQQFDEKTSVHDGARFSRPTMPFPAAMARFPVKSPAVIEAALEECSGNQTRAAELLGISRRTLLNWLDEFGFPRPRKGR